LGGSFDKKGLNADMAAGKAEPLKIEGTHEFIEGVKGQAVFFKETGRIVYDNKDNLKIPGAVSFWVRLFRDRKPKATTYFWYTDYKPTGYIGIQDSVYGRLLFWFHHFHGIKNWHADGGSFPWQQDRWYHILANIDKTGVEVFLDGRKAGQAVFERNLESKELSPFIFTGSGLAVDEIQMFSRVLAPSEVSRLAMGESAMDGKISWFPSSNYLVVEGVVEPEMIKDASLELVVTDTSEERDFYSQPLEKDDWISTSSGILRIRKIVSLPEMKEGRYSTFLREKKGNDKEGRRFLARYFVVKDYPWADNKLGKSSLVIPPFTPIEVSRNRISCVLREYHLGDLGLPEQITSLNKTILSRPVSLKVIENGKVLEWKKEDIKFTEIKKDVVGFMAGLGNKILDIRSTGRFEYDGLLNIKLNIKPKEKRSIERLFLEIPVKEEIAGLFHASGEGLRANPAGVIPEEKGVVFESRSIPQSHITNFIPYIWVGEERRGICWAADWDKDWIHSDDRSAVELVRGEGEVIIRVNLINGPVELDREREIEFALMASPVKPMPEGWRVQAGILWMKTGDILKNSLRPEEQER